MHTENRYRAGHRSITGVLLVLAITAPTAVVAGTEADLRAGVYADDEAVALGGGALTSMDHAGRWWFNPNAELAFGDARNLYTVNGDIHFDLTPRRPTSVWFGAGPAVLVSDPEGRDDSSVDIGLNAVAGVGASRGEVRPFAQMKGLIADNSQVAILGGIRF